MREFLVVATGVAALALLAWWCVGERGPAIEEDLLVRGQAALATSTGASAALSMDGRDATLSGSVPDDESRTELLSALRGVRGIRQISDETTVAPTPAPNTERVVPPPETSAEPADAATDPDRLQEDLDAIAASESIQFVTGSAELTAAGAEAVDEIVVLLRRHPEVRVEIAGHTDDVGARAMNMDLSTRRAETVRDQLVAGGLDRDRFETVGLGPARPVGDNATAEGRRRNRRVEFRILESN